MSKDQIVMYGADWCGDCRRSERLLNELGVEWTKIDVEADLTAADKVIEMEKPEILGYYAIDDYIYQFILPIKQSYAPILPIAPQMSSWSDVSQGQYNNFYTQTYNWNQYSPIKIHHTYLNEQENKKILLK